MSLAHIEQIDQSARLLFSEQQVSDALISLAEKINLDYAEKNPLIICVLIGGLYTFTQLISKMHIPLQMDYLHASRYEGKTSGQTLSWKAYPNFNLKDRHVIIVDDILDAGITLKAIVDYSFTQEATSVATAVLLDKVNARAPEGLAHADYTALSIDSGDYVFGSGMDYQDYLRNKPGIHAIQPMTTS